MLPFPNHHLPPPPPPAPSSAPAELAEDLPTPRWEPLVFWYPWIIFSSIIYVCDNHYLSNSEFKTITSGFYLGNTYLLAAWAAFAIHPIWLHFSPPLMAYAILFLMLPVTAVELKSFWLIFVLSVVICSLLRWGKVLVLNIVRRTDLTDSGTPRLAVPIQFSIRSLIFLTMLLALGVTLYFSFAKFQPWFSWKGVLLIGIPSTLLLFWSILGELRWYIRVPLMLIAIHQWSLDGIILNGYVSPKFYNWSHFTSWLSVPGCQLVSLCLLRGAGYRIGVPKPRQRALPVAEDAEPQSPWN
jgi:hypothetical protein